MKQILRYLALFGIISMSYGQNHGGQTGGEVVLDVNLDDLGGPPPIISVSDDTNMHQFNQYRLQGAGGPAGGSSSGKASAIQGHSADLETMKLIREGYPLTVVCNITHDNTVALELNWFKDNVPIAEDDERFKIHKENSSLVIISAKKEDYGNYKCETVNFNPPKSFNVSVIYFKVKPMTKSETVLEGDKLSLTCDAEGLPMPSIAWMKDGVPVEESVNNTRFELVANDKGTENATYLVEKARYEDRAEYSCLVTIAEIQYNTTTFVRVKDIYGALWPFLGICAEVFILCLIIFIYEKRRAKADFEESDTDQPPEQKNTADNNKDSVRHRK